MMRQHQRLQRIGSTAQIREQREQEHRADHDAAPPEARDQQPVIGVATAVAKMLKVIAQAISS
jgi:hypothetical protein